MIPRRYDVSRPDGWPARERSDGEFVMAADAIAEIKRLEGRCSLLEDHLHGCREEREAAEALCTKAESELKEAQALARTLLAQRNAHQARADDAERTLRAVREYTVEALEPDEDSTVTVIRRGRGHTEEEDWRWALTEIRNMIDNATPASEPPEARLRAAVERVLPALAQEFRYLAVERNFDGTPSCAAQAPQEESWIVKTLREALG